MTLRLDAEDWSEIRLHDECYQIWDEARRKDLPTRKGRVA